MLRDLAALSLEIAQMVVASESEGQPLPGWFLVELVARMEISIAAVDPEAKEIYVDTRRLDEASCRFVLAHEMLHVGLRHGARRQGRDPFLWNVACDYVINGWLVEMGLGELPPFGALHDPALKGLSAEAVYDRIVTDLRRYRKVATLRGMALGDLLDDEHRKWWTGPAGTDLDAFYRRCLAQGLAYHEESGRGLLPSGLVEEIRALSQPPIPWDVELARWFDGWLAPLELRRTYARASRRQQATPDIPRPRWTLEESQLDGRTFCSAYDRCRRLRRPLTRAARPGPSPRPCERTARRRSRTARACLPRWAPRRRARARRRSASARPPS